MTRFPFRPAAVAAAIAVALGGCVSVLPKSKPSQLYSFVTFRPSEAAAPPPPTTQGAPAEVGVLLGGLGFPRAAAGDGILTRTGTQAAYIAESRWVSPAVVLFREAAEQAFDRTASLRLISRGEVGRASAILRLETHAFEARYPAPEAAPTVLVSIEARLTAPDGTLAAVRSFEAQTPAAENRVGPIVDAYTASADKVLGEIAGWVEAEAAGLPPPQARPATLLDGPRAGGARTAPRGP